MSATSTLYTQKERHRKHQVKDIRDIPFRFLQLDEVEIRLALREAKMAAETAAWGKKLKGEEFDAFVAEAMEQFRIPGLEFHFEDDAPTG